jgi:hypothetical protein
MGVQSEGGCAQQIAGASNHTAILFFIGLLFVAGSQL